MTAEPVRPDALEDPLAKLEGELIAEYLAKTHQNLHTLLTRTDPEARTLLLAAAQYASERLSEVEARARYVRRLHGEN